MCGAIGGKLLAKALKKREVKEIDSWNLAITPGRPLVNYGLSYLVASSPAVSIYDVADVLSQLRLNAHQYLAVQFLFFMCFYKILISFNYPYSRELCKWKRLKEGSFFQRQWNGERETGCSMDHHPHHLPAPLFER